MKKTILRFLPLLLAASTAFGQNKKPHPTTPNPVKHDASELRIDWPRTASVPPADGVFPTEKVAFKTLPALQKIEAGQPTGLQISRDEDGLPIFISGKTKAASGDGPVEKRVFDYLASLRGTLLVDEPEAEFSIEKKWTDELGMTHVRLRQMLGGIPVDGGEMVAHAGSDGVFSKINGRHFATPHLTKLTPGIDAAAAVSLSKKEIGRVKELSEKELLLTGGKQSETELVIFHEKTGEKQVVLAWKVTLYADALHRWQLMLDAQTGRVLDKIDRTCSIDGGRVSHSGHARPVGEEAMLGDGPTSSTGTDLLGVSRTFPTYEKTGKQYMIDASESMFGSTAMAQSKFPNDPVSTIWGLDAMNTSPQQNNFNYDHLTNGSLSWSGTNNKKAVSAAYNSITSYKYYNTKHGRKSIDGVGGNIISLINVADDNGSSMENAYWNGEAMFYGNGGATFKPLAGGLDVGGHEMSHGVIEKTANLEYQGESGAMNESFADIFGAMIEGVNWKIGEDVMQSGASSTGCLRDLSNPHNGGFDITDQFWQPNHVNEKYTGSQDGGGVHINSGITNYAYYLFATNAAVGKDKAEKIYYRALDAYLVKSSKFKDLRVSVLAAANDLYPGNTAIQSAAAAAFDAVGITGPSSGGGTPNPGGNYSIDLQANPGTEYMLITTEDQQNLDVIDAAGNYPFTDYLYKEGVTSRPSITDDGSQLVFVNSQKQIVLVSLNWTAKTFSVDILGADKIYRNAAVSKDGQLLAVTTDSYDNIIYVYPPTLANPKAFELTNPTYSQGGAATDEVKYSDVIEFDHSGQSIVYDAYNELPNSAGDTISWWDIGFVDVWTNTGNTFGDGKIEKLFSGLPENTSIGNPTFSKNSPYIVGFDYIDDFNSKNYILGVNTQTGDNDIIYENDRLGWPTFNRLDSKVAFETSDANGNYVGTRGITATKITGTGSKATVAKTSDQVWPVYFATGTRKLTIATNDFARGSQSLAVFPNPAEGQVFVKISSKTAETGRIEIINNLGQVVAAQTVALAAGDNQLPVSVEKLAAGNYSVRLSTGGRLAVGRLVKG